MKARNARGLVAASATAVALTGTLSGCVTVNGEAAVVPTVSKSEAEKTLRTFVKKNNTAGRTYDAALSATIETGPLGAIDQAGLKASKKLHPAGNSSRTPLELSDTRYLIPRQAGWPKFFVTDSASNRKGDNRWVFVFQRHSSTEKWKASYVAEIPRKLPALATDGEGHVRPVPTGGGAAGLAVAPGRISKEYVRHLDTGEGEFAPGQYTSVWRKQRKAAEAKLTQGVRTEFADTPAEAPQFPPFGLRTEDGGALVFFGSRHYTKQTVARGYTPRVNKVIDAMMKGEPKQSVSVVRFSQQAVNVPPKGEGTVTFLSRISGLVSARGE